MSKIFRLARDPVVPRLRDPARRDRHRRRPHRHRRSRLLPEPVHLQEPGRVGPTLAPGLVLLPVRPASARRRPVAGRDRGHARQRLPARRARIAHRAGPRPHPRPPPGGQLRLRRDRRPRHAGGRSGAHAARRPARVRQPSHAPLHRQRERRACGPPWSSTSRPPAPSITPSNAAATPSTTGSRSAGRKDDHDPDHRRDRGGRRARGVAGGRVHRRRRRHLPDRHGAGAPRGPRPGQAHHGLVPARPRRGRPGCRRHRRTGHHRRATPRRPRPRCMPTACARSTTS